MATRLPPIIIGKDIDQIIKIIDKLRREKNEEIEKRKNCHKSE